ncbi:hypothetical protein EB118_12380, partial [bacterium]|nr:hypothetical protein [bacterium]
MHQQTPGLVWRVIDENDHQELASHVVIVNRSHTEMSVENGIEKWNVVAYGDLSLQEFGDEVFAT